jgi:hypothetical protein
VPQQTAPNVPIGLTTYRLQPGDRLTLLDLGGAFLLSPQRSEIDALAERVSGLLAQEASRWRACSRFCARSASGTMEPIRVSLETNALLAALWSQEGGGRMVLQLGEAGAGRVVVSRQVLGELERALRRKAPGALTSLALLLDRSRVEVAPEPGPEILRGARHPPRRCEYPRRGSSLRCRALRHPRPAALTAEGETGPKRAVRCRDAKRFLGVVSEAPPAVGPRCAGGGPAVVIPRRELSLRSP